MRIKIGELARLSGLSVGAIRFYEKEGLLCAPDRSSGNYRLYGEREIERLRFIRHARFQGLSLEEIRLVLEYREKPGSDCQAIHSLIDRHIEEIGMQIEKLEKLRADLLAIKGRGACKGPELCGFVELLAGSDDCPFCSELQKRERQEKKAALQEPQDEKRST